VFVILFLFFSGLKQAGVVDGDFDMDRFVDSRVVTLTE
jgi:hypothetical protein